MIKRFGKVLNRNEEVREKFDWLFTGFNQLRSLVNTHHDSIEKIRCSVKDLSRNIESHKGRLDGIDERLEEIIDRIGDYERERYEKMVEETKEKVDECEQELNDLDASESELRIRELERELELIKNNPEVYNLGYQAGYEQGVDDSY
jgi:DNA repair ATPase RecN